MMELSSYSLEPGFVYACKDGTVIRTVVGSCVAVAVWESSLQIGGMCHFLYPKADSDCTPTARYGDVALVALLKMIRGLGGEKRFLAAHIIGGASKRMASQSDIGMRNIESARVSLQRHGIFIEAEDVGGFIGRKVLFDTATGQVAVLKVRTLRSTDWH